MAPLMAFEPIAWRIDRPPEAIMLTSPQAARSARSPGHADVPTYAVGAATAAAATAAGFTDVRDGGGSVQASVDRIAADGFTRVVHLAGADRTTFEPPPGLVIDLVEVYRARLLPLAALPEVDCVLLYSARTAAHFASEADRLGAPRGTVTIAAISAAVARAAGEGWRRLVVAAAANEAALVEAAEAGDAQWQNRDGRV